MRVTKVKEHGTQRSDAVIFYVSGILPPRGRDFPFQNFWRLVHNTSVPDVKHWDVQRWRTSLWKSYRIIQNTAFLLLVLHKLHDWLFTNQTGALLLTIHSHSYLQVYTQICCRPCGAAERRRRRKDEMHKLDLLLRQFLFLRLHSPTNCSAGCSECFHTPCCRSFPLAPSHQCTLFKTKNKNPKVSEFFTFKSLSCAF